MLFTTSTSGASNAILYMDADKKVTFNPSTDTLKVGGKVYATGYYTETNDRYKLLRSDGGFATFTWSGQSG
jgi:hypothetical protein